MCGIAGAFKTRGEVPEELLLDMAGELGHRGPDSVGVYTDGPFGMVNTRLSIVDLVGGDQPLSNEDGRYWVVQNGEIYNAPELQAELEGLGHVFATRCDTEVLVHAFEQWGAASVEHLNGAFAFAVWDRLERRLFLARDRLGIRPLFIANPSGALLFGSECKAILRHPDVPRRLDRRGVREIFNLWATLPDRSALEGIAELPPGSTLERDRDGNTRVRCYWRPDFVADNQDRDTSADELAERLRELLMDSTRLRLRSDVPVGAYLSGGLDSSATAAIVRKLNNQELRSFAVGFEDPRFDEGEFQTRMAEELGTRMERVEVAGADIASAFPDVIRFGEKPILRTAPAPLLMLSRKVRESRFKVVLTGEGADEIFAGYNIFREAKVRRFWARQPESRSRPRLLAKLYPYLAHNLGRAEAMTRAFFGRHLTETEDPLYSHRIRIENTSRLTRFLLPNAEADDSIDRVLACLPDDFARFSHLGMAQYLEITLFLQGYLLHSQGDRMLMGNSVEGRFPFLDHRLVEFAATVPDAKKLTGLNEKSLLKRAVAPLIPREIVERHKQPYRAPILRAFIGVGAPEYVGRLLSPERLARTEIFDPNAVRMLRAKCERNVEQGVSETDEMALVGVLSTMLLHEQLVEEPRRGARPQAGRRVRGATIAS